MNLKTLKALEYDKIIKKLYDLTTSQMGKDAIEGLMPSCDPGKIKHMLEETEEAYNIINVEGMPPLNGFNDIRKELKMAEVGSTLNAEQLLSIRSILKICRDLKRFKLMLQKRKLEYSKIFRQIESLFDLKQVEDSICDCIGSDGSVLDSASAQLRTIRKSINIYNNRIRDNLNSIIHSSRYQSVLQEPIITIRNNRYVVPLKSQCRGAIKGIVHDQSASGVTVFIEPSSVVEANNKLNQLYTDEKREIEKILSQLTYTIKDNNDLIYSNIRILQQLDVIFAKANLAIDMDAVKPVLNTKMYIELKDARHPLIPKEEVVPIDIELGNRFFILLITGPNTGGKTVALKTLGLLVLMAQSGLFIPAKQGSQISVFNKVFADIGDEQSIEQSLSTFSAHMKNIKRIIEDVDQFSLVLLDELGAGTDPDEGSALAMAILDYLYQKQARTVATTHYSELKKYALSKKGIENAAVEFDINTLSPTYRLIIGVAGKSNAFDISEKLGLDKKIVQNARDLISSDKIRFEDILASLEKNRIESETHLDSAVRFKQDVKQLKEDYKIKVDQIEQQKNRIIQQAKQEARKILLDAKEKSDDIIKDLKRIQYDAAKGEESINKQIEQKRRHLNDKIKLINTEIMKDTFAPSQAVHSPQNIKKGDSVYLLNIQKKGIALSDPDPDGELTVQVGILKVKVKLEEVKKIKDEQQEYTEKVLSVNLNKDRKVSNQIDLRGKQLEEALADVDKFLDECILAGLSEVMIIHGKGTGVLRAGIRHNIKKHPHVKKFRSGKYGEGESGVTVVTLK
ncbi:MAG: endonuclease MutS2 [Clostridia bacterium]|nr:endonuclease MutS2 [Clostridia bacterium]